MLESDPEDLEPDEVDRENWSKKLFGKTSWLTERCGKSMYFPRQKRRRNLSPGMKKLCYLWLKEEKYLPIPGREDEWKPIVARLLGVPLREVEDNV